MITNRDMLVYEILQYAYYSDCDLGSICEGAPDVTLYPHHMQIDTPEEGIKIGKYALEPRDVSEYSTALSGLMDNKYTDMILYNPNIVEAVEALTESTAIYTNEHVTVYRCPLEHKNHIMVVNSDRNLCVLAKPLLLTVSRSYPSATRLAYYFPFCLKNNNRCIYGGGIEHSDIIPLLDCSYGTTMEQFRSKHSVEYVDLYNVVCSSDYDSLVEALCCIDSSLPDRVNAIIAGMKQEGA